MNKGVCMHLVSLLILLTGCQPPSTSTQTSIPTPTTKPTPVPVPTLVPRPTVDLSTLPVISADRVDQMMVFEVLRGHSGPVISVAISPDGRLLASAAWEEANIRPWDLTTGTEIGVVNHPLPVGLDFGPDGSLLASSGSEDGTVRLWDVHTGAELVVLEGIDNCVGGGLAFSTDGHLLVTGGLTTICLWANDTQEGDYLTSRAELKQGA